MKNRTLLGWLAIFVLVGLFGLGALFLSHRDSALPARGTSPWLPLPQFQEWLDTNLKDKPFYFNAAEGRLHNGVSEWRVHWTPDPQGVEWYWYWWYGSTAPEYFRHVQPLVGSMGFDQIWLQSFVDEHGVRKYQSIYLKIIPPKNKPPPPVDMAPPNF